MTRSVLDHPIERISRGVDFGGNAIPRRRRALIGVVVVVGVLFAAGAVVAVVAGRGTRQPVSRSQPTVQANPTATSGVGGGLAQQTLTTVTPAGTPVQQEYDQAFSQGLGSEAGMTAAEVLAVPPPRIAGGWPGLGVRITPETWSESFVAGLLNISYARQERAALGPWLQAQEAPELIAGIPSTVADKVLYISVLDPGIFGGQPTPAPSPAQWRTDASAGLTQSVSDLLVQTDPTWAEMIAAGWQPPDVRMTEEDVSGAITTRRSAGVVTARHFSVQLIVGSSRWHEGYGTIAVAGWTLS